MSDSASPGPRANGPPPQDLVPDVERDLVRRARDGDQAAMGVLYAAYLRRVYRYCRARVGDDEDAADLTEEIFLKVLGAIDGFEWRPIAGGTRSPFGAWLFRIAHNHVVSFHRRAATRGPSLELSETIRDERRGPQELAETQLTIEEVFAAVRDLPDAQREVVLLRFAAGLSVAETAEALGKQQTNVKVLQHKGVQRLKQLLNGGAGTAEGPEGAGDLGDVVQAVDDLIERVAKRDSRPNQQIT